MPKFISCEATVLGCITKSFRVKLCHEIECTLEWFSFYEFLGHMLWYICCPHYSNCDLSVGYYSSTEMSLNTIKVQ